MVSNVTPQVAANAYANSMKAASMSSSQDATPTAAPGSTFADFMKEGITSALDSIKAGEQMSAKAVTGQADMVQVVQAVTSAELTLQSVVALRDRMISAYQEILRMPI